MSVWAVPQTWVNGAVTAAQMNSISTNLTWLKAFADLITSASASDTSNGTYLEILRAGAGAQILRGRITGDANPRFEISAGGDIQWKNPGTGATEVTLRKQATGIIETPDRLDFVNAEGIVMNISNGGVIQMDERSADPAAPGVNEVRLYARDNGAGRTQLVARFATGVVQQVAIQP